MQYLCCRVGHEWYGIEVRRVIEVLHFVALHEIPGAKPEVLGLLTLRDLIMPVIDLRIRFGLHEAELSVDTPIIAVDTPNGPVGLVVDDVDDVEQVPKIADDHSRESPFTIGTARLENRLMLILNLLRFRESLPVQE